MHLRRLLTYGFIARIYCHPPHSSIPLRHSQKHQRRRLPKAEVGSLSFQPLHHQPGIDQAYNAKPLVIIVCPNRGLVVPIINEARKFCYRSISLAVLEKMENEGQGLVWHCELCSLEHWGGTM
ncbi:hypothetical protein B0H65DRAFT_78169 [Neurospora tetraspora]|uniref:Uncharacterized protein n=1 Tax=Neurospora tetraspora TaxID=94610 RepID=A0AAE0MKQ3_9PEZI|nr:hypothetical protein B0H65DRAFT_78169 [Neurospora tetraspora]